MTRRSADPRSVRAELRRRQAAQALDEMVDDARPKRERPSKRYTQRDLDKAVDRVEQRVASGDWDDLRPGDVVAAHAYCHRGVHAGVDDGDLLGEGYLMACRSVGGLIKREFAGDAEEALAFVRWAWEREKRIEARARAPRRRLGWRLLFGARGILTDYRVERARGR